MPEPRARVAICGEKQGFGISQSDGEIGRVYSSIRIVQRLISGKEKKGKGRDGWRRWSAKRPAARLPKNIKKLDGPGWVKAYIRWRQSYIRGVPRPEQQKVEGDESNMIKHVYSTVT